MKKRKRVIRKGKTAAGIARAIKAKNARKTQNVPAKKAHKAINEQKRKLAKTKVNRTKPKTRRIRAVAPPPREVGLLDAIGEAFSEIESLAEEMRSWADGMEEKFGSTQKYDDVNSAADTLENMSDPVDSDTMSFLNDIKITVQDPTPRKRGYSRAARCGQATDLVNDVILKLTEEIGDKTGPNEDIMSSLKDDLEEVETELQGVEFPGMYG